VAETGTAVLLVATTADGTRGNLGSRQEIIQQYGEGFWFVIKAHPPAHIVICAGGCNAKDEPKDQ
jgi:hypothetical protein